jgi:phosphate transport system permease protein
MRSKVLKGDITLKAVAAAAAIIIIGLLGSLAVELFVGSTPSIDKFGLSFILGKTWDSLDNVYLYGAPPFIYGTILTSAIALLIGIPISLGVAIFLTEKLKEKKMFAYVLGTVIELLAVVPSVIYGLWGVFVLSPLLRDYVEAPLHRYLGFIPIFAGAPSGSDFFTAGVILAIMIIPTVSAISRDILNAVPNSQREAMYSLGGTDWEVTQKSVLPYARSGIFGAIILGLGRAVGETMAVTMVIGNMPNITASLFSPGYTLSSVIANVFTEAPSAFYRSTLIELGLILFFVALIINLFARLLLWRMTRGSRFRV